jgi:hypothetical protein
MVTMSDWRSYTSGSFSVIRRDQTSPPRCLRRSRLPVPVRGVRVVSAINLMILDNTLGLVVDQASRSSRAPEVMDSLTHLPAGRTGRPAPPVRSAGRRLHAPRPARAGYGQRWRAWRTGRAFPAATGNLRQPSGPHLPPLRATISMTTWSSLTCRTSGNRFSRAWLMLTAVTRASEQATIQ